MKKLLTSLLCVVMVVCFMPTMAWAAVADTDVAKIGDTGYATLQAAVDAAPTNGSETTITLLKTTSGDGVKVVAGKNIVFELDNKTYTINDNTVGSTGTETNGFQLLSGSTVTFQNGTIKAGSQAKIIFQNYCNLTLNDVTLDAQESPDCKWALSCNHGKTTISGNTNIYVADGNTAVDVYYWPSNGYGDGVSVTVDTAGEIKGNVTYGSDDSPTGKADIAKNASLDIKAGDFDGSISTYNLAAGDNPATGISVTGGTFSDQSAQAYVPAGTKVESDGNGKYVLEPKPDAAAKIGNVGFATLQAAVDAAASGDTITLLNDVDLTSTVNVDKDVTIDLGEGKVITGNNARAFLVKKGTLTLTGNGKVTTVAASTDPIDSSSSVIRVGDNTAAGDAGLVIDTNVTVEAPATYGVTAFGAATNEAVTVKGKIHATGDAAALSGNGTDTTTGTNITIEPSAEVIATKDAAIYHPQPGTLTVKGGTIKGTTGIEMKAGTLNVTGNPSIEATAEVKHVANKNGTSTAGYAVAIVENNAYAGKPTAELEGGTYSGEVAILSDNASNPPEEGKEGSIEITGGKYDDAAEVKDYVKPGYVVSADGTVTRPYIPTTPTTQKPVIESADNATVTLSTDGTQATIKVADGYELVDVTVNGVSKGKVETLTGLKTGDKIVVKTQKKADDNAALIEAVKNTKLVARTAMSKAKGKKAVKVYWYAKDGSELNFDGYEVYRSLKRYEGFGTKPFFKTAKEKYYNTAIKKGTKYYYKVRAYKVIDGEKVYTDWSTKAWRTVK